MTENIVVSGSIAQKPSQGGHTWAFLQYVIGLRKLGWNVMFVDQLASDMCIDLDGRACGIEGSANLSYFVRVMENFGLSNAYALLCDGGERVLGLSRARVLEHCHSASVLLNVMGFLRDAEILDATRNRVFLDIDPGFGQMWQELGLHSMFTGHHHYVTIGENIGRPDCGIPTCGQTWITTRQPIVLDYWQEARTPPARPFTTIASWRGTYGPVPYQGKTYGLRVHEFRKFMALPTLTGQQFELALDIHPADSVDRRNLENSGWAVVDPNAVASDPQQYQNYVRESTAEFMVAKNMYVDTRSGWFSDRSICYLASGRPVLVQDTGLRHLYPTGEGLLTFTSVDEAAGGVQEISTRYDVHARAARALAVEYFDSNKVLTRLLEKVGAI
jgi:hypothetical protein